MTTKTSFILASCGLAMAVVLAIGIKASRRRYPIGVIMGKFYPPHAGHEYLIRSAATKCSKLYVFVIWKPEERPEGHLRRDWLRDIFKDEKHVITDAKEDIYHDDDNSELWAALTREWISGIPDAVFTSEKYGDNWARCLGCVHVQVDFPRKTIPISGTKVRNNPFECFDFMHPVVRQYYSKLICVIGPESCGKTVLCNRLAMRYFGSGLVREYGRDKTEELLEKRPVVSNSTEFETPEWRTEDFVDVAQTQTRAINDALQSSPLVFADTDALATQVWHQRYFKGAKNNEVEEIVKHEMRQPDLYLLCVTKGANFVQDGLRDGEDGMREWMNREFRNIFQDRPNVIVLDGSFEDRFQNAVKAINAQFPQLVREFE